MKRKIHIISGVLCALSFLLLLGIAGGMDKRLIELLPGSIGMIICTATFGIFAKLSGTMETFPEEEEKRTEKP